MNGLGGSSGYHLCRCANLWHSSLPFARSPCSRLGSSFHSPCNTWLADRPCSSHTSTAMPHTSPRSTITPSTTQTPISCQTPQGNDHSPRNCSDNTDSPAIGTFPRYYVLSRDADSDMGCPHWRSCP